MNPTYNLSELILEEDKEYTTQFITDWCYAQHHNFFYANTLLLKIGFVLLLLSVINKEVSSKIKINDYSTAFLWGAVLCIGGFIWGL